MLLGFRFSRYQRYPSLYRLGCQVIERSHSSSIEELPPGAKEVKTTVSSLRIDNIASAGLNISRRMMWEHFIDGHVLHNGKLAEKKSTIVKEGDVIDVDSPMVNSKSDDMLFRRGRVVVKEIGEQTKKSRWHVTLLRHKQFDTVRTGKS